MSRQYSILTTLRMVPNCLLEAFFERLGHADDEFPWGKLGEREVGPMIKWISLLPVESRNAVDAAFRNVYELACHTGMEALFESAASCGDVNLAEELPADLGPYAKAMWACLHRPEVFERALLIHQVERTSWWRKRWDLPKKEPDMSEVALSRLRRKISELLLYSQGRGQFCTVEALSREDGTDYFFAYPDDFVQSISAHDDDGLLAAQAIRPTFSIVFAYRRDEGSLEMYGRVPANLKRQLEQIFAKAILDTELGPWKPIDVYELDHLKYRSTRLETDPEDRVRVKITKMWLFARSSGRRICVATNPANPDDDIHRALEETLNKKNVPLSDVMVTRVQFEFDFLPLGNRLPGTMQVEVGRPNTCTLRHERPERIAICMKCLRYWDVDRGRFAQLALATIGT